MGEALRAATAAFLLMGLAACATAGPPPPAAGGAGDGPTPGDPVGTEIGKDALQRFVRKGMVQLTGCYQDGLRRNRQLRGLVRFGLTVHPDGRIEVTGVLENQLGDEGVVTCLAERLGSWRTPFRPAGPVTVDYPFIFAPR